MAESKNNKSGGDHPSESFGFDGGAANKEIDGGAGRGRGQGDSSAKPWQQDGDWMCPNTRSVTSVRSFIYPLFFFLQFYISEFLAV